MAAMKGWIKHKIVVARPTEACIVAELHVPNSTNIITKAAIVIDQVSTMKNLCHLRKKSIGFFIIAKGVLEKVVDENRFPFTVFQC